MATPNLNADFRSVCDRLSGPVMRSIPHYGDHMTLQEFVRCVKAGGYIDYDGVGYLATEKDMTDIVITPSHVMANKYSKLFSHIVWFNR